MSRQARWGAILLVGLGLWQMVADLAGASQVSAVAAASGASPAPKIWGSTGELETFISRVDLSWKDAAGTTTSIELTPKHTAHLTGPDGRRTLYRTLLTSGPTLAGNPHARPMVDAVAEHALCGTRPLLSEIGVAPSQVAGALRLHTRPTHGPSMKLTAPCE